MAAPSTTVRTTPGGTFLDDGYQTLIAFSSDPDVSFGEKTVTPPGIDGGDKIDTTTMHNSNVRTYASRSLYDVTDAAATVAYDPEVLDQIIALINVEQSITFDHSNSDTWDIYGVLKSFIPDEVVEGEQPTATIEIYSVNRDSSGNEETINQKTSSGTD